MESDLEARLLESGQGETKAIASPTTPLTFDPERYRHHIAHLNMSEAAQNELMETVWRMMQSFVDCAFGDDPVQLARKAGDKARAARDSDKIGTLDSSDATSSDTSTLSATFSRSGGDDGKERRLDAAK